MNKTLKTFFRIVGGTAFCSAISSEHTQYKSRLPAVATKGKYGKYNSCTQRNPYRTCEKVVRMTESKLQQRFGECFNGHARLLNKLARVSVRSAGESLPTAVRVCVDGSICS